MKKNPILGAVTLALVAAGCSSNQSAPMREANSAPWGQQLPTATYWDFLAEDVVAAAKESLARYDYLKARPLHVAVPTPPTPFASAYRNLLITRLVENGFAVSEEPQGAVLMDVDPQLLNSNELVTTTYMRDTSGQYLMRHTDIHFISDSQAALYLDDSPANASMKYMEVVDR